MLEDIVIFDKSISFYSILWLVGIFVCGILACKAAKKEGLNSDTMLELLLFSSIGIVVGGHLLYALTNYRLIAYTVQNLEKLDSVRAVAERIVFIFGGSVFYGGLFGGILFGGGYIKKKRLAYGAYTDIIACIIPLFHAIARVGCFLSGCCYGIPCQWGFVMQHSPIQMANNVCRFPVQLLESVLNLCLFFLLLALYRKKKLRGELLSVYLIGYAVIRFFDEFLRGDEYRGIFFGGLSTSQLLSLLILIIVPVCLLVKKRRARQRQTAHATDAADGV